MLKFNSIAAAFNVSANGNYCQLTCNLPPAGPTGVLAIEGIELFDSGCYDILTGAGVSGGSVSVAKQLYPSGTWQTVTTPNSTTGAAFTLVPTLAATTFYTGSLGVTGGVVFPCSGLRFVIAGLTGGNIVSIQLTLTKR